MAIEGLMRGVDRRGRWAHDGGGIALPPMIQSGDEGLNERWVRPALTGEKIAALAVTEPGREATCRLGTRAVLDGDHYVVTGNKLFITSGVRADVLTTSYAPGRTLTAACPFWLSTPASRASMRPDP